MNNTTLKGIRSLKVFGKMTGGYFIATIINNALPFLLLPILTRYLSPDDYASIALFTAFVAIVVSLSGYSINTFIAKFFFDHPRYFIARIVGNGILVLLALNTVFCVIFLVTYNYLSDFYGLPFIWVLLIPVNSFAYLVFQILLAILRNEKKVLTFSYNQIGNTIINVVLTVLFVVIVYFGWQGRILGILLSNILSAVFAIVYLKLKGYLSLKIDIKIIRNVFNFIVTLIPSSLQSVIINRIGIIFMQIYFTKELLGIYSVGFQIAYVVMIVVITLNLSWTPYIFEQLSNDNKRINKFYITRLLYLNLLVVVLGVLFVNFAGEIVLKLMTTPDYFEAKQFIFWLTLGMFFNGFYMFLQPILIKSNQHRFIGISSLLIIFLTIIIHYFSVKYLGPIGISFAYFLTYFLIFIVIFIKSNSVFRLPWLQSLTPKKT